MTEILEAVGLRQRHFGSHPEAMARGRSIHKAMHYHAEGDLATRLEDFPPDLQPYWAGYLKFHEETQHKALGAEIELVNEQLGLCGHLDLRSRLGAATGHWIIDLKTGSAVLASVSLQLAGYRLLWDTLHPDDLVEGCACLILPGDGSYRLHEYDASGARLGNATAVQTFTAALLVHRAQQEINP